MDRLRQAALSPLQELDDPLCRRQGVQLLVKRDDQRFLSAYPGDQAFGGNKWRKLQYNLFAAREQGYDTLLTFGGAFSNHIAATAAAGSLFGFRTTGIIRGEPVDNPTLQHARRCGMTLHFLDRATYRQLTDPQAKSEVLHRFGQAYVLPEGGTNQAALGGCAELGEELTVQHSLPAGYYALPVGTGGTLAGLICGLQGKGTVLGFPVLRGGAFLHTTIQQLIKQESATAWSNWNLLTDYHFGGYAKFTPELIAFIRDRKSRHDLPLDPVYTGKCLFGLFDLIGKGFFPRGATIVFIHTGGLQGIAGFNQRFGMGLTVDG